MLAILTLIAALNGVLTGVVRDTSGAIIPGAAVIVRDGEREHRASTGADGRFNVTLPSAGEVTLVIRAAGFAEKELRAQADAAAIDVTLDTAGVLENVTVTATRTEQRLGDVPASVSVLSQEDIRRSPAVVADDVLRQLPTFSLFRRTSSLSSHPTAQGVSLRGIGPSGVSRTLVLLDGVPFNDPFGGWVYWTRVPLDALERIEVVDGSTSHLYGNYAMGGVISLSTARARRRTVDVKAQYGNRNSPKVDALASDVWGKVGVLVQASSFDTDGFPIVVPSEFGVIDNNATVKYSASNLKVDYTPGDRVRAFARAGYFSETRGNGKVLETNDTRWTSINGGVGVRLPDNSDLQAHLFGDIERFHSTFLAVTAPSAAVVARSIVRLTTDQRVPTHAMGGLIQWGKALGTTSYLSAGTDWRWVDGDSQEDAYNAVPGPVTPPVQGAVLALKRVAGGTQRSTGAFVQDVLTPTSDLTVTLGARVDRWLNYDGHNRETAVLPGTIANDRPLLPERSDTVVSPRVAARYQLSTWLGVWGNVGAGFRAPTLNELYRQFRVGTVLTLANEQLGPERLRGGEVGVDLSPIDRLTVRTTWYENRVRNPVSNVTLTVVGANVTQQRQNLGATSIRGIQTDVQYRIGPSWRVAGGYLFNRARVTSGGATNAGLVGKTLPQVPTHRGSLQASYTNPRVVSASFSLQFVGRQFDDDQNVRGVPARALSDAGYDVSALPGLPGYAVVDVMVSRGFGPSVDVFVGAQNLLNQTYFVGTLPTTIGSPRLVNGGVRVRLAGR